MLEYPYYLSNPESSAFKVEFYKYKCGDGKIVKKTISVAIAVIAIVVVAAAVLFLAQSSAPPAGSPATKHYSGSGISFDYPSAWETGNSSGALVTLTDRPENVVFGVMETPLPAGTTLKTFNDATVMAMNPLQVISGDFPTVDGLSACRTVLDINSNQTTVRILFVCFVKDNTFYALTGAALPGGFDTARASFDAVINSFKVTAP